MEIVKIEIESEGEHNGYFTLHFKDGSTRSGWSCDQGSIEMDDELPLPEDLHNDLMDLWFEMDIDDHYEGRHFSTWTPETGLGPTTRREV